MDLATALDMGVGGEEESKLAALRSLQSKKVKALLVSLDAKDKEIAKLKALGLL